ncbi:MAG: protein translocase SEC61 complex subunit gamma [Candidatus Micrarchaeota archaeon]
MDIAAEIRKMVRVLKVATRPNQKEFVQMAKVTAVGVAVMGLLGVIIAAVFSAFEKL